MTTNSSIFFVYVLHDPTTGEVRWVGQTVDPISRLAVHRSCGGFATNVNRKLVEWLVSLEDGPEMRIVCIVGSVEEAIRLEKELIKQLRARDVNLLNGEPGGGRMSIRQRLAHGSMLQEIHRQNPGTSRKSESFRLMLRSKWPLAERLRRSREMTGRMLQVWKEKREK